MRYRMLETIAEYAAERLDESGERAAVERRAPRRTSANSPAPPTRCCAAPGQLRWLDRLEREHENLRAALRRAVAAGDEHGGAVLVLSLHWFWELRDYRSDAATGRRRWPRWAPTRSPPPVAAAPRCTNRRWTRRRRWRPSS